MLLVELFKPGSKQRIIPWKRDKRKEKLSEYTFPFDDGNYHVIFELRINNSWDIDFGYISPTHEYSQDIIGTEGSEIAIFATIIDIVHTFIKDRNPTSFTFTAEEPSRQKLYRRIAKRFGDVKERVFPHGIGFTVQLRKAKK